MGITAISLRLPAWVIRRLHKTEHGDGRRPRPAGRHCLFRSQLVRLRSACAAAACPHAPRSGAFAGDRRTRRPRRWTSAGPQSMKCRPSSRSPRMRPTATSSSSPGPPSSLSLRYAGEVRVLEPAIRRPEGGRPERRASRPALPGEPALPVQHPQLAVVAHSHRQARAVRADDPQPRDLLSHQQRERRSHRGRLAGGGDRSFSACISISRRSVFGDRLLIQIDLPQGLAAAQVPGPHPAAADRERREARRLAIGPASRSPSGSAPRSGRTALPCAGGWTTAPSRGRAIRAASEGNGVGLRNVRDRLAARFGDEGRCVWGSPEPGRFVVELTMPMVRDGG